MIDFKDFYTLNTIQLTVCSFAPVAKVSYNIDY